MLSRLASNNVRHALPAAAPVITVATRHMSGHDAKRLLLDIQTANFEFKMKTSRWTNYIQKIRHFFSHRGKRSPRLPDFQAYPDPVKSFDSRTTPIDWSMASNPPAEEILVGDELLEHQLRKEKKKISAAGAAHGPFGTPEKPVIIPTYNTSRIAGCVGGIGKEHDLLFFMIHADEPKVRCPRCDQVFQLEVHEDHHHEHTAADDAVDSYREKYGRVLPFAGTGDDGHGHGQGHDHDHDHDHGPDAQQAQGLGPDPKQHVH